MAKKETVLIKSVSVLSNSEIFVDYIPGPNEFTIAEFVATAAFSSGTTVELVWDRGGPGEELLWTISGESEAPTKFIRNGDGIKKLSICLDNTTTGSVYLSGYALIVEDL